VEYLQSLEYLYSRIGQGIKLGLEGISSLLEEVGNPQRSYPVVLVGGTNGKGSVVAALSSILSFAGLKVGVYTSPHLVTVRERIAILEKGRRRIIPPVAFSALVERVKKSIVKDSFKYSPTFFEYLTAMAYLYFSQRNVDIAIMEVGLGGRLDATNVVNSVLSVITSISFDHKEYLGETLREIAREKAGIIKAKTPVISGCNGSTGEVIKEKCRECSSPLYSLGKDFRVIYFRENLKFSEIGMQGLKQVYTLKTYLLGEYQKYNLPLAVASAEVLSSLFPLINKESICQGIGGTRWPGRMEVVRHRPLIIMDGAHNPRAAQMLAREIEKKKKFKPGRITLIFGVLKEKEREEIMKILFPIVDEVRVVSPRSSRAVPAHILQKEGLCYNENIRVYSEPEESLKNLPSDSTTFVAGSLYLVGEMRKYILKLRGDRNYERV